MKNSFFILPVLLAVASFSPAYADSITGSIGNPSANYDLNDYDGFAYYGDTQVSLFSFVSGTPSTDLSNTGSFSDLSVIGGGSVITSGNSPATITYTDGTSTPQSSATNSGVFYTETLPNSDNNDGDGTGISLTTKLFAPTEEFQFLLEGYNAEFNLSATLNDAASTSFSDSDVTLPEFWPNGSTGIDGSGNTDGLLTLTVTGTIGETLTFSDIVTNSPDGDDGNSGIEAATAEAIPEPSTWAMLLGGFGMFAVWRNRKRTRDTAF